MRDRLIELLKDSSQYIKEQDSLIEHIADYLLANGVIVPPCKVGDMVYFVHKKCDEKGYEYLGMSVGKCEGISIQKDGRWIHCRYNNGLTYWHKVKDELGKTVFLTKEEAEQKLKERDIK